MKISVNSWMTNRVAPHPLIYPSLLFADNLTMKTVAIINASSGGRFMFEAAFGGVSAYQRVLAWALRISGSCIVFASNENEAACRAAAQNIDKSILIKSHEIWTLSALLDEMARLSENADAIIYASVVCPFMDDALTAELLSTHETYKAEYTFADGYPYGVSPEILDKGIASILSAISKTTQKKLGDEIAGRESIMSLLKTDINSFEIETVLSPKDFRLYRLAFECGTKAGFLSCQALYDAGIEGLDTLALSEKAISLVAVLKTVPAFYNVQIEPRDEGKSLYSPYRAQYEKAYGYAPLSKKAARMSLEQFQTLTRQMAALSENAVVSLSCWGEPLFHPQFAEFVSAAIENGLSVLVETSALHISEELCKIIKTALVNSAAKNIDKNNGRFISYNSGEFIDKNNSKLTDKNIDKKIDEFISENNSKIIDNKIIWIVTLDAASEAMYKKMRGIDEGEPEAQNASLASAIAGLKLLAKYFPNCVYPQFVRTNENENELESFFRYWKDEKNGSNGNLIIQKYDSFCGLLPDKKPADISPLERNPCWHLRRDMTILADGSVPLCRERIFGDIIGNAFSESLESIWQKMTPYVERDMCGERSEACRNCDEWYTFNF